MTLWGESSRSSLFNHKDKSTPIRVNNFDYSVYYFSRIVCGMEFATPMPFNTARTVPTMARQLKCLRLDWIC